MVTASWMRWLVIAAVLLPLAWVLFLARAALPPFLIAFVIAVLLDPLLDRLEERGWSRAAAASLVFALFLLVFLAAALVVIPTAIYQAQELIGNFDTYQRRLIAWFEGVIHERRPLLERLNLPTTGEAFLARYQGQIESSLHVLVSRITEFLGASLGKLLWLVIIPIVTFYLLLDIDRILLRLLFLVRQEHRDRVMEVGKRVVAVFTAYLRGLFIVCAGYGIVNGLLLALFFRLPYSLVIGLLAGILYAVPYIGAVATVAIGVIVALATPGHSASYVVGVGLTLLVTNQLFDQIITPRVVGGQVGLHPVLSIFALMVAGDLFGLAGMLLAFPVAASIRVVLIELFPVLARPLPGQRGSAPRRKQGLWRPRRPPEQKPAEAEGELPEADAARP